MELMLARRACLIWQRPVRCHGEDTVADGALGDSVEVKLNILVEECQTVDNRCTLYGSTRVSFFLHLTT